MSTATLSRGQRLLMLAGMQFVMREPFFGTLYAHADPIPDSSKGATACTDGKRIFYNPDFIEALDDKVLVTTLLAHETLHIAMGHCWRRGQRDPMRWNIAIDFEVDYALTEAKFAPIPGGLRCPKEFANKSCEWIYEQLPEDLQKFMQDNSHPGKLPGCGGGGGNNEGDGISPEQLGQVIDTPEDEKETQKAAMDVAVLQAVANKMAADAKAAASGKLAGNLPSFFRDYVRRLRRPPQVDWVSLLREYVTETARNDYSWKLPARNYICQGLYLPSLSSPTLGPLVVAVDTSGSIDQKLFSKFLNEVYGIFDGLPISTLHYVECDCQIGRVISIEQGDPLEVERPTGGGGTAFTPVFDWIAENEIEPSCVIYLTDLYGDAPSEPEYPVIWCVSPCGDTEDPAWGITLRLRNESGEYDPA